MGVFRALLPRATRGSAMSVSLPSHYKKNLLQDFERAADPLAPPFSRRSTRGSI